MNEEFRPTFSVSEFVGVFNQTLDVMYPEIVISGELTNFRISKNRWVYFDLKDEISSVKFFGVKEMLPGPLEDGMNLEVFGYPRLHNRYGFSVNVNNLRVVGAGSIAKAQDMLAKKLESEGLFATARKRDIPYPPSKIGLITSLESAAYVDFTKIVNARWGNVEILVKDCLVQGLQAPEQIIRSIDKFNLLPEAPDVLVIIRGGGSADDLSAFSTEQVVRAVAASRIPTLVAIGHEVDMSLAELASDKRASTPSNAAEMLVPDRVAELSALDHRRKYMLKAQKQILKLSKDEIASNKKELTVLLNTKIDHTKQYLDQKSSVIKSLNPRLPLEKGYVIVRGQSGAQIRSSRKIKTDDRLSIQFGDGKIKAKATSQT